MNRKSLAPIFLIVSVALVVTDFFLPSAEGIALPSELAEWGLLGLSLFFLVLFIAFRRQSF